MSRNKFTSADDAVKLINKAARCDQAGAVEQRSSVAGVAADSCGMLGACRT